MYDSLEDLEAQVGRTFKPSWYVHAGKPQDSWFLQERPPAVQSPWPVPDARFAPVHDACRMQRYWNRLESLLRCPTESADLGNGFRAVQVLGAVVIVTNPHGVLLPLLWAQYAGSWGPNLWAARNFNVTEIPPLRDWLEHLSWMAYDYTLSEAAWHSGTECKVAGSAGSVEATASESGHEYFAWMFAVFRRRMAREFSWSTILRQVRCEIGLDEDAWRLSHKLVLGGTDNAKASIDQYNIAIKHKAALLDLEREAPNAIPCYAAVCTHKSFPITGEATQRLRCFLAALGIPSGVWRMVVCEGNRIARHIREFYQLPNQDSTLDCLRILAGLHLRERFPQEFMRSLFAERCEEFGPLFSYCFLLEDSFSSLRHVARIAIQEKKLSEPTTKMEATQIIRWICAERVSLDRKQRQAGWRFLVRGSRHYEETQRKRAEVVEQDWHTPFKEITYKDRRVVALTSADELYVEGAIMHNCLANYTQQCATQTTLIVSIRNQYGRPLANGKYGWTPASHICADVSDKGAPAIHETMGHWVLEEARGPANRRIGYATEQLLSELARDFASPQPPALL